MKPWEAGTLDVLEPRRGAATEVVAIGQTVSKILTHVVFSTKGRRPFITEQIEDRLWAYMTGIVNDEFGHLVRISAVSDQVHMRVDLKPTTAAADMLRVVKSKSSKWVHDSFAHNRSFAWQSGYGSFSVAESQREAVIEYIDNQHAHHQEMSFQEELLRFLKRYNVPYDERYIWE